MANASSLRLADRLAPKGAFQGFIGTDKVSTIGLLSVEGSAARGGQDRFQQRFEPHQWPLAPGSQCNSPPLRSFSLLRLRLFSFRPADRLLGPVARSPVLTPESSARYKTVEFDIVEHANRFAFRGDNFHDPHRPNCGVEPRKCRDIVE